MTSDPDHLSRLKPDEAVQQDIDRWHYEIDSAESLRDRHMLRYTEMIDRFAGPAYSCQSIVGTRYDPEAFSYEYVSLMLPRLVFDNPRIVVKSRSSDPSRRADAIKFRGAINLWCRLTDIQTVFERIALDYLLFCGIGHVLPDAMPWLLDTAPASMPRIARINPGDFLIDPQAPHWSEASWMGHRWTARRRNLLRWVRSRPKSEGWDDHAVEQIGALAAIDARATIPPNARPDASEDMIEVFQIWEASEKTGTIFVVARDMTRDPATGRKNGRLHFIRRPAPYRGPRCGPYVVFGAMAVPQSPWPLSPIMAIDQQISDHNDEVRATQASARAYKRGYIIDGTNRTLAEKMQSKLEWVHATTELTRDSVIPYEIGGVTEAQVRHLQLTRERLDRVSGFDDVMRGNISGRATATEVAVAETAATIRVEGIVKTFRAAAARLLWSAGWMLWNEPSFRVQLDEQVGREVAELEPVFVGGDPSLDDYQNLDLEIEPHSMARANPATQQQLASTTTQMVAMVSDLMGRAPWVRWDRFFSLIDQLTGIELESLINMAELQEGQETIQQAMAEGSSARLPGFPSPPSMRREPTGTHPRTPPPE